MIEIKGLNKYYRDGGTSFHALKDVDLCIEKGSSVALKGRSGAGKSTLLHILGCLDQFDTGEYVLEGVKVRTLSDGTTAKLRNQKLGFVMQDFSLINHRSVLFNTMLPMYFDKTASKIMKEKAMRALNLVGIADQAKKRVSQLSGGQRQRVAIARAIVKDPICILADEPTGALDSNTSTQIMELLKEMNEKGMTLIVVTHDDLVASYCKRQITIEDGRIVQDCDTINN